jgi:hypothetical protein
VRLPGRLFRCEMQRQTHHGRRKIIMSFSRRPKQLRKPQLVVVISGMISPMETAISRAVVRLTKPQSWYVIGYQSVLRQDSPDDSPSAQGGSGIFRSYSARWDRSGRLTKCTRTGPLVRDHIEHTLDHSHKVSYQGNEGALAKWKLMGATIGSWGDVAMSL